MLRGCDGIICLGKFAQEEVKSFIEICSNIVFLDMRVEHYNITSLTMDFKQAVRDALDYLYHLGHRKIGFMGGKEYVGNHELLVDPRLEEYIAYMKEKNLPYEKYLYEGSFNTFSGYDRINVEFAQVLEHGKVRMRVWERGSGITQACGTGACATAVAAALTGKSGRKTDIIMDGGSLTIEWDEKTDHVWMTGGAVRVFDGEKIISD